MTRNEARPSQTFQCKIEQSAQILPAEAVLLDVVRMFETRLHERRMLSYPSSGAFPLWFLVETERNTFLWRRGLSLADACLFEFWINPVQLVEKRIAQLELNDSSNPFTSVNWDENESALSDGVSQEHEYLHEFLEIFSRSAGHLHALSIASAELLAEQGNSARERVVLPAQRRAASSSR